MSHSGITAKKPEDITKDIYNYYLKDVPNRCVLDKYFTTNKIQEITQFEIFNHTEIEELINIFTYKPIISGAW